MTCVELNDYWTIDCDLSSLTVYEGSEDQTVTGGGWIDDELSINGKGNFGFTVKYNKKGDAKGNFVYVYRTDDYIYRVKSNSWKGGGLSFTGENQNQAFFSGRCNIQKIDRSTGVTVESWGNSRFLVDITDGDMGGPQNMHDDSVAFAFLLSDGTIWKQIGTFENQVPLGNGNIVIHK